MGWIDRRLSIEAKQVMFWALLAARCAGEENITRNRVLVSLLRSRSVAEQCARSNVAPEELIAAIEEPASPAFEECARRILDDLERNGLELGSKEHIASVQPLPLAPAVQTVMQFVMERRDPEREVITALELLQELIRADPILAARLADHGLDAEAI